MLILHVEDRVEWSYEGEMKGMGQVGELERYVQEGERGCEELNW